jgi:hypothetical protein
MIHAEVRFFFTGRNDWETELFEARSETELYNKARDMAKQRRASHFNCGVATEEIRVIETGRRPRVIPAQSVKDQVKLIEEATGRSIL